MLLGALALAFAIALSIPLGVVAALRPNSLLDRVYLWIAVLGQAMPSFWFALMLILVLGVWWRLLPISGTGSLLHYIMPAIALGRSEEHTSELQSLMRSSYAVFCLK